MAFLEIEKNSYEVTGKTLLINYETDELLTKVQLSKNGVDFIDAIAFSQLTAMFDLSDWNNGDYANCILRGHYDDIIILTNISKITVNERESAELELFLDKEPERDVTVVLSSENTGVISMNKTNLIFTKENYDIPQTVTITGIYNSEDKNFSTNLLASVANAVIKTIPVTIVNTDIYYGEIVLSTTSLSINEGNSSTINVSLSRKPTNNQTVTILKSNENITLDKTSLTFTPDDYNVQQSIKVTGVYDSATSNKTSLLTFKSDNVSNKTLNVTIVNTDVYAGIVLNTTALTFNEGSSSSFTVKLDKAPSKNQVVSISYNSGITLNKTSLTFTPSNYNTAQTVTITSTEDTSHYQDKTLTITLSSPNVSNKTIAVTLKNITQSNYGSVITDTTSLQVNEGATTTLSVKLDKSPTENQTVTLSKNNNNISLDKTSLVFTPSNYNTYQTVTVTGIRDSSSYIDKNSVITLSSFNGDNNVNVTIKNTDIKKYTITRNYTNCSGSNTSSEVNENSAYTNTITVDSNYELESIKVTMGGEDITTAVLSGNTINIPSVTGDVVITATAVALGDVVNPTMTQGYIMTNGYMMSSGNYVRTEKIEISEYSNFEITLASLSGENAFVIQHIAIYDNYGNAIEYITANSNKYSYEVPEGGYTMAFDVSIIDTVQTTLNDIKSTILLIW